MLRIIALPRMIVAIIGQEMAVTDATDATDATDEMLWSEYPVKTNCADAFECDRSAQIETVRVQHTEYSLIFTKNKIGPKQ